MQTLTTTQKVTLKPLSTIYATKQTNLSMMNKLNLLAVERYSKTFAAKICETFFENETAINGRQILDLTSFQQLNLLIIKNLYDKWQAETKRLQSPYFDFGNADVQAALKAFMNVLSQHISVKKDAFEALLQKATQETLWLLLNPYKFFSETFRDLPNFKLTQNDIAQLSKYLQVNKAFLPLLAEKLEGQEFIFANQAIEWIDDIISRTPAENAEEYLAYFEEMLPLPAELLPKKQVETSSNGLQHFENSNEDSFFDNLIFQEGTPKIKPVFEPFSIQRETPKIEPKPESSALPVAEFMPPIVQETPKIEEPIAIIEAKLTPKEPEDLRLNDHLASEQKTLNDQATQGKTVLDFHQSSQIDGISKVISLNQRFLFTNNLFGRDSEAFQHAVMEIELCKTFMEAKEILLKKYVPKYFWDITSAEAEEFIDIVKRRFN